ncbi:hypothetical protein PT447_10885 [Aliarcobacter butzleri]|uniref:hypothetical protein n=1 Tax=Aliarcobacter butzleri TaxID=28197 RepID=UPI0024DE6D23|nr:hypothetical protein [Aliarcobacter butzleri]MDK2065431.1 hypothetical protein [Aliarcobacter butzleri]
MNQKIDEYADELILFTYKEITENALNRNSYWFNFEISKIETYISNQENNLIPDGEDLKNFKIKTQLTDDGIIKKALVKNINEKLFIRKTINGEFNNLEFTEDGMKKAKAILLNRKEKKKKILTYSFDKILVPIIVASLVAIITSYITTKLNNDEINKKIESLEKEIKWLKEQK